MAPFIRGVPAGAARTAVLPTLCAVVVVAVGFGLQALGLRKPRAEELFAARAAAALRLDRPLGLTGRVSIHDRVLSSVCLPGLFRVGPDRVHGYVVLLSNGSRFVAAANAIRSVGRPTTATAARAEVRIACPAVLAKVISRRLAVWSGVRVTAVTMDRRPAYRIRVRDPAIVFLVDRQTLRSVDVRVANGPVTGWSDLTLRRLTVGDVAALRSRLPQ